MYRRVVYIGGNDIVVIVDGEITFTPGHGLPVVEGDKAVEACDELLRFFPHNRRFALLDKHPYGHISLASSYIGKKPFDDLTYDEVKTWKTAEGHIAPHALFTLRQLKKYLKKVRKQMLWSDHGIIGGGEDELAPPLTREKFALVFPKGMDPKCDSYSALRDNCGVLTGFDAELKDLGYGPEGTTIVFGGLAFDICLAFSTINAVELGYKVFVVLEATRAVNQSRGAMRKTIKWLESKGVHVIHMRQLRSSDK